eukprot:427539-Amphidinium_carterae.1
MITRKELDHTECHRNGADQCNCCGTICTRCCGPARGVRVSYSACSNDVVYAGKVALLDLKASTDVHWIGGIASLKVLFQPQRPTPKAPRRRNPIHIAQCMFTQILPKGHRNTTTRRYHWTSTQELQTRDCGKEPSSSNGHRNNRR